VIEVAGLTKHFGPVTAVDDLTFTVAPGRVTGFLGPNGAGKTTTLRCLLGLVSPTRGSATFDGRAYAQLPDPTRTVGAALEASGFHPGRTGRNHLRTLAVAAGLPADQAEAALAQVGMLDAADRRVAGYSLGMRQRLALAAALLGDPQVLVLDEPANGLDPEGIAWLRGFLRHVAGTGRTVLLSSHVLAEVAQTVDDVVIIDRGRLVRAGPLTELTEGAAVVVRSPDPRLPDVLRAVGLEVTPEGEDLVVHGADPAQVGRLAFEHSVELHGLHRRRDDLEQVFLRLTGDDAAGAP
jgi:ABC-2 type transport system ATP-binding protein